MFDDSFFATARITALMPGQPPPPVRITIRFLFAIISPYQESFEFLVLSYELK